MELGFLPPEVRDFLLNDAILRDRITARRACLIKLLYRERFLNREQIIIRIEGELGRGCFGGSAWKDVFFRDMRVVKKALRSAEYRLAYSRNERRPGYYLYGEPSLSEQVHAAMNGSVAEVDLAQIAALRKFHPSEKFFKEVPSAVWLDRLGNIARI